VPNWDLEERLRRLRRTPTRVATVCWKTSRGEIHEKGHQFWKQEVFGQREAHGHRMIGLDIFGKKQDTIITDTYRNLVKSVVVGGREKRRVNRKSFYRCRCIQEDCTGRKGIRANPEKNYKNPCMQ